MLKRYPPPAAGLYRELVAMMREIRPDFTFKVSEAWQTVNFHHPRNRRLMTDGGSNTPKEPKPLQRLAERALLGSLGPERKGSYQSNKGLVSQGI
jgi:hypothetical protein